MSHAEVLQNHPVHNKIRECNQVISEISKMDGITADQELQMNRIHTVLNVLNSIIEKTDPFLLATNTIDNISNNVQNITSYLVDFKNSCNNAQITNALSYVDSLCNNLGMIYFPLRENEIDSIRDSAISFRQSIAQHLRHTSKEAEETRELIKNNREEINSLAGSISSEQQRLTNILSSIQREYDNIEAIRKERFENFLEELNDSQQNEFNKLMDIFKEQSDQIENDREVHRLNAEEILHDLGSYSEKAKQILGTLSIDSHAAGYKREADRAWTTKIVFYTITGLLFGLLMFSAYWNSLHSTAQFTWQSFASKWTVTIAIGAAVTYFARQAARQEQIERENRNMQLQIATIDPYIEIFEEDERKEIKKQLVDRIFTGVRPESIKDSEKNLGISPIDLPKLIDSVGNVIKINNK